jgi:dTMP kinase
MFAARREHIARVIAPALAQGRWVVSDRFTDSTYAYQGAGGGMAKDRIAALERWVQGELRPDLTLLFDVPVELAVGRLFRDQPDRFESENQGYFERVRAGYLQRAAAEPERVHLIAGEKPIYRVKKEVEEVVSTIC